MSMSKSARVVAILDTAMPDEEVAAKVRAILAERAEGGDHTPLETNGMLIPADAIIEVVTKVFFKEYGDLGFSTGCRVQVAIGGVIGETGFGWVAKHCFATLFFTDKDEPPTVEFHNDFR